MPVTYISLCPKCGGTPGGNFRKVTWSGGQALLCEACAAEVEQQAVTDQAKNKCCGGDCSRCAQKKGPNPAHVR